MADHQLCQYCSGEYSGRFNDHLKQCRRNPYVSGKTEPPQQQPDDQVLAVLNDPNLFQRIILEISKSVVGETKTIQTIVLCGCGSKVENCDASSYNVLVNSISGVGKDYVTSKTLAIFPKDSYIKRTRVSERVFTYWHNPQFEPDWTWNEKIFYNEDISGSVLNSEVFKVMCSSGSSATVLIKQVPVDIEIKGKPVIICTTARAIPDRELLRRFAIISCDEGLDQTSEITKRQGQAAEAGKSLVYDENITAALAQLKRVKVKIPFGVKLAEKMPHDNVIVRTAFPRLLDYIKAATALHQYQRQTDADTYYMATRQDYEIAKIAFEKTTANQHFVPLTHEQRKLIEICKTMEAELGTKNSSSDPQQRISERGAEFAGFSVDEIAERCNFWEDRWLRTQLNNLADIGVFRTSRKAVADSKKPAKTYLLQDTGTVRLPTWEELDNNCMNCTQFSESQPVMQE